MINKSRLAKYIVVGATAYAAEMSSLYGLIHAGHLSPLRAVAVSFWVGFVIAFVLQKLVTFQNYEKHSAAIGKQIILYSLLVAWNYGFTILSVKALSGHGSVFVIRTFVILVVTGWNYLLYQSIFKDRSQINHGKTKN